jgi:hypothetical protein
MRSLKLLQLALREYGSQQISVVVGTEYTEMRIFAPHSLQKQEEIMNVLRCHTVNLP